MKKCSKTLSKLTTLEAALKHKSRGWPSYAGDASYQAGGTSYQAGDAYYQAGGAEYHMEDQANYSSY